VFARSGRAWIRQAKLTPGHNQPDDDFGQAVAMSGSDVVVGAPGQIKPSEVAYLYVRSRTAWARQPKLATAASRSLTSDFGMSAAVSGSTVVVGADGARSGHGAVYVFVRR
jgi:hypothetical protein